MAQCGIALRRRCSRWQQCAGVRINLRHDSIEWRRHARIREHGFIFVERSFGGQQGLFGCGQGVLGCRDSGAGFQVFALRHVNFLLRDQFRPGFLHVGQPRVGDVRNGVGRFRPALLFVRARYFLLGAPDGCFVLQQLLLQLGNFQHGQDLALFHVRAPIHVQLLDVAGNFRVHVDFLVGQKFRGDFQRAGKAFALHFHHGCLPHIGGIGLVRFAAAIGERG